VPKLTFRKQKKPEGISNATNAKTSDKNKNNYT